VILCRVQLKRDGTLWRKVGEVKGKLANGVGSQYSHATSEYGIASITTADAHTSAASSRLNWRPRRFKWSRPFRRKTKSGVCACAITFQTQSMSGIRCRLRNGTVDTEKDLRFLGLCVSSTVSWYFIRDHARWRVVTCIFFKMCEVCVWWLHGNKIRLPEVMTAMIVPDKVLWRRRQQLLPKLWYCSAKVILKSTLASSCPEGCGSFQRNVIHTTGWNDLVVPLRRCNTHDHNGSTLKREGIAAVMLMPPSVAPLIRTHFVACISELHSSFLLKKKVKIFVDTTLVYSRMHLLGTSRVPDSTQRKIFQYYLCQYLTLPYAACYFKAHQLSTEDHWKLIDLFIYV
jgi:hypothetical protein